MARSRSHHHVYVVELSAKVLSKKRFRDRNPDRDPVLPCLYVGSTGLTPEVRFANHLAGIKACPLVREYGLRLLPALYQSYNPMSWRDAAAKERELADLLRRQGFAVWQN